MNGAAVAAIRAAANAGAAFGGRGNNRTAGNIDLRGTGFLAGADTGTVARGCHYNATGNINRSTLVLFQTAANTGTGIAFCIRDCINIATINMYRSVFASLTAADTGTGAALCIHCTAVNTDTVLAAVTFYPATDARTAPTFGINVAAVYLDGFQRKAACRSMITAADCRTRAGLLLASHMTAVNARHTAASSFGTADTCAGTA